MGLTLRLLKEGRTVEAALRDEHGLRELPAEGVRLFIGSVPPRPPDWRQFVRSFVTAPAASEVDTLATQSASAILFVEVPQPVTGKSPRTMAVTFGHSQHALTSSAIERNFGLRVTLNCVARSNLRTLDTATLDDTTFIRRIQSSREADLQGFEINIDRDLLRLAAGTTSRPDFARSLAGRDSLILNASVSPSDLASKCKIALERYLADDYKRDFSWIDNIAQVRDAETIQKLDAVVFAELNKLIAGKPSDLHLAFPEIMSPEEVIQIGYFGFGTTGRKKAWGELSIEDYVSELKDAGFSGDMQTVMSDHEVRVIKDGIGDKHHTQNVYDCFIFEAQLDGITYVLFGGEWYAVENQYRIEVENDFQRLLAPAIVKFTRAKNERDFIAELGSKANHLILDQVKITPTGTTRANVEPCDVFTKSNQFIHLKDGHGSAPISHLWSQGVVAAELFVSDESFRTKLFRAVQKRERKYRKTGFSGHIPRGRIPRPAERGDTIIYGILRHAVGVSRNLDLPFFSKVSLRPAAQRLQMLGYKVELHLIEKR